MYRYGRYLLCVLALLLNSQQAMATINLGFSTPLQTAKSLDVELIVSGLTEANAPSLSAYDIDILFDSAHLQLAATELGNQLDVYGLGENISSVQLMQPGRVNVYELSLDWAEDLNSLQAANFSLASLHFDILKNGSSALQIIINELVDGEGNILHADSLTSSVTTVPLPGGIYLMLTAVAFLIRKSQA